MVVLVVGVQHNNLIAEEPSGFRPPVRDQGLGRRQFQLQLIMQERTDLSRDLLSLLPGTGEAQQPVIGLWGPVDYADRGVMVLAGELG
jgi:hypothetical protein